MYFPSFRGHRYFQNEILGFPLPPLPHSLSSFPHPTPLCFPPPPTHSALGNLLGVMVQDALRHAMESDVAFRRGLPCNLLGLPGEFRDNADVATSVGGITSLVKAHGGKLIGRLAESLQVTFTIYSTRVHSDSAPAHTLHFSCRCCMLITRVHYFFNPLKSSHTLIGQFC